MTVRVPILAFLSCCLIALCCCGTERAQAQDAKCLGPELAAIYKKSYALVIANTTYGGDSGYPTLTQAKADADRVAAELEMHCFQITRLDDVDSGALFNTLQNFIYEKGQETEDARLVIWISGHGDTLNNQGFLIPAKMKYRNNDPKFLSNVVAVTQFKVWLTAVPAKHVLVVMDACMAGTIFSDSRAGEAPIPADIKLASKEKVRLFITSGGPNEKVADNGNFSTQFVATLSGRDSSIRTNDSGFTLGSDVGSVLSSRIAQYTNSTQHPKAGKLDDPKFNTGDIIFKIRNFRGIPTGDPGRTTAYNKVADLLNQVDRRVLERIPPLIQNLRKEIEQEDKRRQSQTADSMWYEAAPFIINWEIGTKENFEKYYSHPSTIGLPTTVRSSDPSKPDTRKYSFGLVLPRFYPLWITPVAKFRDDWKDYLSAADMALLEQMAAKRTDPFDATLPYDSATQKKISEERAKLQETYKNITISYEAATAVFRKTELQWAIAEVFDLLPNAVELPPKSLGALVSLVLERGSFGFTPDATTEQYAEMREIKALMADKKFTEIPAQFRNMTRLWPEIPSLKLRREAEANLFEQGLKEAEGAATEALPESRVQNPE